MSSLSYVSASLHRRPADDDDGGGGGDDDGGGGGDVDGRVDGHDHHMNSMTTIMIMTRWQWW